MKVYFLRHQAAGVLDDLPFAEPPTDMQRAAVMRNLRVRYGTHLPRTGEPYWLIVVERDVLGPLDVPDFEPPSATIPGNTASVASLRGGGSGSVASPD